MITSGCVAWIDAWVWLWILLTYCWLNVLQDDLFQIFLSFHPTQETMQRFDTFSGKDSLAVGYDRVKIINAHWNIVDPLEDEAHGINFRNISILHFW